MWTWRGGESEGEEQRSVSEGEREGQQQRREGGEKRRREGGMEGG